jgi:hypothetical protein
MDIYASLAAKASHVSIEPSETSYFSNPGAGLDPRLFRSNKLVPSVRSSILRILFDHLKTHYYSPDNYVNVWLAGSAVSYQWSAARNPADLDCLIGINYLMFRQANPDYKALSDQQIADMFNADFRADLHPLTKEFMGAYELTFFVNVRPDIRSIKPYAAYSLTTDDWTVQPEIKAPPRNKMWEEQTVKDTSKTTEILSRYSAALTSLGSASTDTARRNAEAALKLAVEQGAALFDEIHHGRTYAFSPGGQGYMDKYNYRWQAGKSAGIVQALRQLKDVSVSGRKSFEESTYGMELPDTSVLIRRALGAKR